MISGGEQLNVIRLKTQCGIKRGASPRPIDNFMRGHSEKGARHWIRIGDTQKGSRVITTTKLFVTAAGAVKSVLVAPGDLLLSNSMSFGEPYISGIHGCIHDGWLALTPSSKIMKDYLYWCLLSEFVNDQFRLNAQGATVNNLNIQMVGNVLIPIRTVREQLLLVEYLDHKTTEIDHLLDKLRRQVELLEQYRRELIARTVTRGLNPDAPMRDSGIDWMPKIPVHWIALRGKRVFRKLQRPVPPYAETVTCFRDGTVTLRKNRRSEGYTESLQEIGYQGIAPGDLVIHEMDAFAGAIGVSDSVGKSTPVYAVCALRNGGSAKFYAYLLRNMAQSNFILSLAKGIRQRTVDFRFKTLASLLIPVPPVKEQQQIAIFLDNKSSEIDATISNINKQIELLEKYRKQIINDAVTGKVRVGEMA